MYKNIINESNKTIKVFVNKIRYYDRINLFIFSKPMSKK